MLGKRSESSKLGKGANLLHVVDHEDDDAAGVEEEHGDDVDQGVSLHLAPLLTGQSCRVPILKEL